MERLAKNFICFNRFAVLSSLDPKGYPFGSIVPYLFDKNYGLVVQVANIAEHYKNLLTCSKSSLMVSDPFFIYNPAKYARATIFCEFLLVNNQKRDEVRDIFKKSFPDHIPESIEPTFSYFCSEVLKVRWIGGFGQVGWVSKEKFYELEPDPICTSAFDILAHMNLDHTDAIESIARFKGLKNYKNSKMVYIDSKKFIIRSMDGEDLEVEFNHPCTDSDQIRKELILITNQSRGNL